MPVSFRRAMTADLPIITTIYNQAIRRGGITDDDQEVTVDDRQPWFDAFTDHFPLWVILDRHRVIGFVGLEEFFPHPNFDHSAQVCLYLDNSV